jgi:hypothetical protein
MQEILVGTSWPEGYSALPLIQGDPSGRLFDFILSASISLFKPPRFFTPRRSVQNDMQYARFFTGTSFQKPQPPPGRILTPGEKSSATGEIIPLGKGIL